jgi:hypothetical protein
MSNHQKPADKQVQKTDAPSKAIAPQNTVNTTTEDRTPDGDTSRGVDTGAMEIGATGKRGQFAG